MADAPHVLILGGGFVAYRTVRRLRRAITRGEVRATVVTRDNALAVHGLIGEMVTGRIRAEHGAQSRTPRLRTGEPPRCRDRVDRRRGEDESSRAATSTARASSWNTTARWSCVGSGENLEVYPGLAEHAFRLKSFHDCIRLKNHIVEMLELADIETDPEERRRLLTFFVAGGGFSGTELAGELADLMRRLTKREYPGIAREECRVLVVHPGPTLLPELYGSQSTERERARLSAPRRVRNEPRAQARRGADAGDQASSA